MIDDCREMIDEIKQHYLVFKIKLSRIDINERYGR